MYECLPLIAAYTKAMGWSLAVGPGPGTELRFTLPPAPPLDDLMLESPMERMAERQTRRLALRRELAVLRAHRLEPKRLAFVKNKPDAAPWLFLVEAQKNRRTGLRIEPDVLITAGAAMYGEVK